MRKYVLQTAGALIAAAALAALAWDGLPFLVLRMPGNADTSGAGVVTDRAEPPAAERAGDAYGVVLFEAGAADGSVHAGQGWLPRDVWLRSEKGQTIDVAWWGGRPLAVDDVRWQPLHRRPYWLYLAGAAFFALVGITRFIAIARHGWRTTNRLRASRYGGQEHAK